MLQAVADPPQKARRVGAVDDAVVIGEGERQHLARLELPIDKPGFHGRAADAQDGHLGPQHDGGEPHAADAPLVGDAEAAALQLGGLDLLVAGSFGQVDDLDGQLGAIDLTYLLSIRFVFSKTTKLMDLIYGGQVNSVPYGILFQVLKLQTTVMI